MNTVLLVDALHHQYSARSVTCWQHAACMCTDVTSVSSRSI
jgi:hypothetical protein